MQAGRWTEESKSLAPISENTCAYHNPCDTVYMYIELLHMWTGLVKSSLSCRSDIVPLEPQKAARLPICNPYFLDEG